MSNNTVEVTATTNSEKIESVYPEIRQFYRDNPTIDYWAKALDRTFHFFKKVTGNDQMDTPTDNNGGGSPITRKVNQIYRVKPGGDNQEFIYWHEALEADDYIGNLAQWDWVRGRVEVPKAHYEFVPEEGKVLPVSIDRHEVRYTISYDEESLKELASHMSHDTKFAVDTGTRLYSITRDSFFEDIFEDCVEFAATGHRPERGQKNKK